MEKQIKIGIIGTGVGLAHLKILQQLPEYQVAAIAGQDLTKTQRLASEFQIPFASDDYQKLLEQDLDAVIVASPNDLHFPMFQAAASRGLNIILEKPAGINQKEVQQMQELALQNPKNVVVVDHELRFHPAFQKIKELISLGKIGKPVLIQQNFVHNLFSNPEYKFSWMNQAERGGGQLQLVGTHLLDLTGWWLDFPAKFAQTSILKTIAIPERQDAIGKTQTVTAEDTFSLQTLWGETIVTISNATRGFGYKGLTLQINGSDGVILFSEQDGLTLSNQFGKLEKLDWVDKFPEINVEGKLFPTGMKHFWAALAPFLQAKSPLDQANFCTLAEAEIGQEILAN